MGKSHNRTNCREFFFFREDNIGEWFTVVFVSKSYICRMEIELFEDIIDEDSSDSFDIIVSSLAHVDIFFVCLILDITEYFFEDILHRDDSRCSTMLIEDECDMATRFLELLEEIIEWLREGNLHDLIEREISHLPLAVSLALELERFTEGYNEFNIVRIVTCYWETRV
jgi:hypothetical protein